MPTVDIQLNGERYVCRLPITRYRVAQQSEAIRETAEFLRTNNPKLEPFVFNDWRGGFGRRTIRAGHPEDRRKFYDATALTIWPGSITLALDASGVTDPANYFLDGSCVFSSSLWAAFTPTDNAAAQSQAIARSMSAAAWGGGGNIFQETALDVGIVVYDLIAAGSKMYCIMGDTNDHILRYSTDGITWTAPSTTPPPLNLLSATKATMLADDGALLAYDGTNVVLALHDAIGGEIEMWKSTNGGDTWTNVVNFPSGGGPTGIATYLDTDDTVNIYVGCREGLWMIDITPATAQLVLALPVAADNCRRMAVHNGALYVPVSNGDSAFGMKRLTVNNGGRVFEDVGLNIEQEIPTDLMGPIWWMISAGPWLFASVGGDAASRNGRIIAYNGLPGQGWQNVFRYGTANSHISWVGFDGTSLHWQTGNSSPGDTVYAPNLLKLPSSGAALVTVASGYVEMPEMGGDAPAEGGAWFQGQVDSPDLDTATTEYIAWTYGKNGVASTTTTGGNFTSSAASVNLGTSSRGDSARTLRNRLVLNRRAGDTSKNVTLREFVVLFKKKPTPIEGYVLELDLIETVRQNNQKSYEQLVADLETVNASAPLVPLIIGQDTEREVELVNYVMSDWLSHKAALQAYGQREGIAKVTLEEVL